MGMKWTRCEGRFQGQSQTVRLDRAALKLDCGVALEQHVDIGLYALMARSMKDKSNAILICHALTGDQYPAGTHPVTDKAGWWTQVVGAGRHYRYG